MTPSDDGVDMGLTVPSRFSTTQYRDARFPSSRRNDVGGKSDEKASFSTARTCGMSSSRSGRTTKGMVATVGLEVTVLTAISNDSSIRGMVPLAPFIARVVGPWEGSTECRVSGIRSP